MTTTTPTAPPRPPRLTGEEQMAVREIVARGVRIACTYGIEYARDDMRRDLLLVHANGCPLRLLALAEARSFDFIHDLFGIRRYLDRTTGRLRAGFRPRYAARPAPAEA